MGLADLVAGIVLVALIVYALLGGADFGGGVWDLLARGPRKPEQREAIAEALAPVWEANHVWLIVVVVVLFTCFPVAFAAVATALHVPLAGFLLGIVFRGSAFTFRHYDTHAGNRVQRRWGRTFAVASVISPVLLGICLGAVTAGIRLDRGVPVDGFFRPWVGVFPFAVGLLALALFAFLAAAYLTNETSDRDLAGDFRLRALWSLAASAVLALVAAFAAGPGAAHFRDRLLGSWWTFPLLGGTAVAAAAAAVLLWTRRYRVARLAAGAVVTLVILGWGLAQYPFMVAPDITVAVAKGPDLTLELVVWALAGGSVILLPSLWALFRIFKHEPAFEPLDREAGERSSVR
jgi:cytochrome d ubiquinol oxidase subunit II